MRIEDLIGRRLGRYEIISVLGRGGMAAVYRAHDTALRRDVALKVLYPQYAGDSALVERFQREAVLAANLDHPNILPIYDVGEADGLVYIAMRLLDGRSFADILRLRGALAPAELLPIVSQIAAALDYAHARQIIHRDIKPANILIEGPVTDAPTLPAFPHAVLTDFGIAKSLDPAASGLTVTGVLIGTPEYMAPEQIRGSQLVDARADIYALGVLVYRALTGRRPFEGGTQEILMGHLQGHIPSPSSIAPALPPAVDGVMQRVLAREPEQRYRSAGEFVYALRAALGLEPDTPPPALRRAFDARAVVPQVAMDDMAGARGGVADQPTRKGAAMPPPRVAPAGRAQAAQAPPPAHALPAHPRGASRSSNLAFALLGLVLALAIGGGILYAAGLLRSARGQVAGLASPTPTEPPTPTATVEAATSAPSAAPTATAEPPTAAPSAAPTATLAPSPKPSPKPKPSATPAPTATTLPASPTPSATPSATPSPSATPTSTPTPTEVTPTIPLQGGFKLLLEQNPQLAQELGDPRSAELGGPASATEQQFENGSMFYFKPTEEIYVLYDDKTWQVFEQSDLKNLPAPEPADCPAPMAGGFALVWSNFPKVRERLGCSTAAMPDLFEGAYQPFQRGTLLWSKLGLGRGPTIYVLFVEHSYERHKDPNA